MGMLSFISGGASVVMMLLTLYAGKSFRMIPTVLAVISIILGIISARKENSGKGKFGFLLGIIYFIIFAVLITNNQSLIRNQFDSLSSEMNNIEERSSRAHEDLTIGSEKDCIELAASAAKFEDSSYQTLTYENFNNRLKKSLKHPYTLTGPDYNGNFTLKIETRTYIINSDGHVIN